MSKISTQSTTAQSLGALLKSARDIMPNDDLDHLPDVLKLPLVFHHDNLNEIISKFGGADHLRTAVNQLQSLLYAA